jgi:hypothetical protein
MGSANKSTEAKAPGVAAMLRSDDFDARLSRLEADVKSIKDSLDEQLRRKEAQDPNNY